MTYSITPADAASITAVEKAFSTIRFLPAIEDIPADFIDNASNPYVMLTAALALEQDLPDFTIDLHDGLKPEDLNGCVMAHLKSFSPKHEHKISGVAYMISCLATLNPSADEIL